MSDHFGTLRIKGLKSLTIIARRSRSSRPQVFLRKAVQKIYSKFTGEHQCRSVISIKLQSNFIEIAFRHGCSPVNLLHIEGPSKIFDIVLNKFVHCATVSKNQCTLVKSD